MLLLYIRSTSHYNNTIGLQSIFCEGAAVDVNLHLSIRLRRSIFIEKVESKVCDGNSSTNQSDISPACLNHIFLFLTADSGKKFKW